MITLGLLGLLFLVCVCGVGFCIFARYRTNEDWFVLLAVGLVALAISIAISMVKVAAQIDGLKLN